MATHSSILAWRTPWTEEPGGLQTRLDSSRLCSLTDLCPLLSLMLSSGSEGTTNLPAPSSVASRLLSPLVHSGHFFKTMLLFLGGGGGASCVFPAPLPLWSPSPVKPPQVRHRNSPSCETKAPEFKIAALYYLYSSRKEVFLRSRLFGCGSDSLGCRRQLLHCINISLGTSGR